MGLTPEYMAALMAVGRVFGLYRAAAGMEAVLVGGAAVNLLTEGAFFSGDFAIQASNDDTLNAAFLAEGFVREDRAGHLRFGFYHPAHPLFGFQQVSGLLTDGRAALSPLRRVPMTVTTSMVLPLSKTSSRTAWRVAEVGGDMALLTP